MEGGVGGTFSSPASTPLTWNDFLERMRQPSAADFVKSIKSFIVSFTSKVPNPEEDSAAVQQFLANMVGAFRAHPLWAGCSEEELESAGEGLEKYVMTKLFNHAFASNPEEKKHDEELYEKMALVQQFIRPENLDIKPTFQNETSWLLAQKELQKINMYKAPRDKLVCILNCCKVINNLLLNASLSTSENHPGADEFLPVLIYVTIKANPPQLYSNLLYIQRYRRQSHLVSEPAYYFTNIFSAESFIWNIDAKALSIGELEFQNNMESARVLLPGLSTNIESIAVTSQNIHHVKSPSPTEFHDVRTERMKSKESQASSEAIKELDGNGSDIAKSEPVSVLETKGASDLLKEEELRKYFSEYQFLYASAGDLTIKDVETLLDNYKQLVLKYVSLSKGIGAFNPSFPSSLTEKSAETSNSKEPNDAKEPDRHSDRFDEFCKAVEDSIGDSPPNQTDQTMESNDRDEFPEAGGNSSANKRTEDGGMLASNLSSTTVEPILNSDTVGNSIANIPEDFGSLASNVSSSIAEPILESNSEKTQ